MADETVGQKLIALRTRSGLSLDDVAKSMGLRGRSSVQRLFVPHLEELGPVDAFKLAETFDGKGSPPISRAEVLALSKFALSEVLPAERPPRGANLPKDVPVYGTAMGAYREGGEGQEIEQATFDPKDVIEFLRRPPGYADRTNLYALYVSGYSMSPRYESGDPIYVDPKRPPSIGDDVVVYLMQTSGEDRELEAVLVKTLIRRSASYVELGQYNPETTFRVETLRIKSIHRVIPRRELLGF